jgi:hypothetical protein
MARGLGIAFLAAVSLIGLIGCDGGLVMGSKAMGVRSGEFIYGDGYVASSYHDHFDRVWEAAVAVMKDMKAYQVQTDRKIAKGTISGLVSEEKVTIKMEYQERDKISVAILVGLGGSRIGARSIHDKITQRLSTPAP